MIATLAGLGGILAGGLGTAWAVRQRRLAREAAASTEARSAPAAEPPRIQVDPLSASNAERGLVTLLAESLRRPVALLRHSEDVPAEILEAVARTARLARMLSAGPRPMQAKPVSPIVLLEAAAERVEKLRLGKVPASWTLRCRQPVHIDPKRGTDAFRELLETCADADGEAGRLAIRIVPGERPGYPVCVELEIGRRGAAPETLPLLAARRLLENDGARVEVDGGRIRIDLRSAPPVEEQPASGPSGGGTPPS